MVSAVKEDAGGALASNEYHLDREALGRYISAGRLYAERNAAGLFVFADMDWYYSLFFFINPAASDSAATPKPFDEKDKPVQFELMTVKDRKDARADALRTYWTDAGFELNSTRLRLTAEYDEESVAALEREHEVIHEVKVARPDQFDEGLALLLDVFDPVTSIFPGRDDMRKSMEDGNFLVIEDGEGRIICIIECEFGRTNFKLWRIATDRSYVGQRFHWHCRRYATRKAFGMGLRRNIAWVEDWNAKSTHNITSMGMKFDGRISEQYILKGRS
jgi:hypothetical protein